MRIGIRISIYDAADNEIAHQAVWVPSGQAALSEWRPTYDAICEAIWEATGDLCRQGSTYVATCDDAGAAADSL